MRIIHWLLFATIIFSAILAGCGSTPDADAAPPRGNVIASDRDLNEWLTYYYAHPRPDAMLSALEYMDESKATHRDERQPPVVIFLAMVLRQHPRLLPDVFKQSADFHLKTRKVIWFAAWEADLPAAREQLRAARELEEGNAKKLIDVLLAEPPTSLKEREIESATDLDMLWSAYFATGDKNYVERIINVLAWTHEKEDATKLLLGVTARWSLAANARRHKPVMTICKKVRKKADDKLKPMLDHVLAEAEGKLLPTEEPQE